MGVNTVLVIVFIVCLNTINSEVWWCLLLEFMNNNTNVSRTEFRVEIILIIIFDQWMWTSKLTSSWEKRHAFWLVHRSSWRWIWISVGMGVSQSVRTGNVIQLKPVPTTRRGKQSNVKNGWTFSEWAAFIIPVFTHKRAEKPTERSWDYMWF